MKCCFLILCKLNVSICPQYQNVAYPLQRDQHGHRVSKAFAPTLPPRSSTPPPAQFPEPHLKMHHINWWDKELISAPLTTTLTSAPFSIKARKISLALFSIAAFNNPELCRFSRRARTASRRSRRGNTSRIIARIWPNAHCVSSELCRCRFLRIVSSMSIRKITLTVNRINRPTKMGRARGCECLWARLYHKYSPRNTPIGMRRLRPGIRNIE